MTSTPWSSKTIPTETAAAPTIAGPSKAAIGVAAVCAVAIAGAGYMAFTYDRTSDAETNNTAAASTLVDTQESGSDPSQTDLASEQSSTGNGSAQSAESDTATNGSDSTSLGDDSSATEAGEGSDASTSDGANGSSGTASSDDSAATSSSSDADSSGDSASGDSASGDSASGDSASGDSTSNDDSSSDDDGYAADQAADDQAAAEEQATAVSRHEPRDDLDNPDRRAIFSRGILFLRGELPTQEAADVIVAKAVAVMGEDRVVVQYTINPEAELTGSAPFVVEDVVLFESGSNVINPQFEPILNFGIALLRLNESVVITIVGHTDSHGSTLANEQLAHARTAMVAQYWLDRGVSPEQIAAVIKGESEPIADNSTPEGAQANRRVEFIISGILLD